ncbi:MAG: hypothetical protein IK126_03870 [Bacteroidales bacterium]|nr:hypothetical protein [Bacteroidales bacterium]
MKKNLFKLKKNWWKILLFIFLISIIPVSLNIVLGSNNPFHRFSIIGDPKDWLTFWGVYLGSIGTLIMAVIAFSSLKQNDLLAKQNEDQLKEIKRQWEEQNRARLSCSLAIGKDCIYIEIKNIASVPAHNVNVSLEDYTEEKGIYEFDTLCDHLAKIRFEISPFEIKQIPVWGVSPYVDGKYGGYLAVILSYNGVSETFNLYLEEINVTAWKYYTRDVCDSLKNINSTIDEIKRKI